jgi:sigma-B regulation protein RsbU (phosphoserine phosphatase)
VGGDLYFVGVRPGGSVLVALGDVTGKGMPAALAMSAATVAIGLLADIEGDLRTLAQRLHRQLFKSLADEQFITLFLAELEPGTGHIRYVNAGHEAPLVVRKDGALETLASTTLPFAMIEDIPLEVAEADLRPGDSVAIFSDGISEATTDGERFLGLDGVKEALVSNRAESLAALRGRVVNLVEEFLAGGRASDDVTLLMLRRLSLN